MNINWKFAEYVILLDSSFLRQTVRMVKEVMTARLSRPLPPLDLVAWFDCLLLDAGLRGKDYEVQVLLTHEAGMDKLDGCLPSALSQHHPHHALCFLLRDRLYTLLTWRPFSDALEASSSIRLMMST